MTVQLTKAETNTSVFVNLDNVRFYEPQVVEGSENTLITFTDGSTLIVSETAGTIAQQELAFASLRGASPSSSARQIAQDRAMRPQRG